MTIAFFSIIALWLITFILFFLREQYWILERKRWGSVSNDYETQKIGFEHEIAALRQHNGHLQDRMKEHVDMIVGQRHDIMEQLQSLCGQVLRTSQTSFVKELEPLLKTFQSQAQIQWKDQRGEILNLVNPLARELESLGACLKVLEQSRLSSYVSLNEQVIQLAKGQQTLSHETNKLMMALRSPHVRGCWGEMQLRRVVELTGMVSYCDFQEQASLATDKKNTLRPDMIIHLPGNRKVIVDAKTPLSHYLEATSASDSQVYDQKMRDHARILAGHIKALSDKNYWSYAGQTPELTILFLPGESFLSGALEKDATLLEKASAYNIILATPMTLIALLKTIAYGWKQETFSQHSQKILSLSQTLQKGLEAYSKSMHALGRAFKQGHSAYHEAIGAFANTVLPVAQELASLKINTPSEELESEA